MIPYRNKTIAINSYRVSKKYSDGKKRIYTHINKSVNKKLNRLDKKISKNIEKGKYTDYSKAVKDSKKRNKLMLASKITEQRAREWLKESKKNGKEDQ